VTGAGILAAMSKRAVALKAARELAGSRPAQALRARLPGGLRPGAGGGGVCCPLSGTRARRFLPFGGGTVVRPNARCAHCDSLERHRLIWLYLRNETDLFSPTGRKRMLHVAPEPVLRERLIGEPLIDYLSADLEPGGADVQMDITAIDFPADSFDVIYCSHVLEHVPDDALAMRELCRVLRPTGWAILQVPILLARTDEDPSVTDPEERL
jgi:SAM-dependent methyltransferase